MENKLQERLGIRKTEFSTSILEIGKNPFPIEDKELQAIPTFWLPEYRVHDENNCE